MTNVQAQPTGLSGPVLLADSSNQLSIHSENIALISCDPYSGNIQPVNVLQMAQERDVKAVILYSETSEWCTTPDLTLDYEWLYSMKGLEGTTRLLEDVHHDGQVYATIAYPRDTHGNPGKTSKGAAAANKQQNGQQNPLGPSPSTAVAMIILYSITGIITALFLIIIITGALRAHRHPERYGPRNIMGRPRQSRARGLARALLDTLPIVKTGEPEALKPTDVELADGTRDQTTNPATGEQEGAGEGTRNETAQDRQSTEGGIAAAINGDRQASVIGDPGHQGCSICTEDFEAGQDQRVLPCDHRFHPACIDPWLLNVSGTCPMCRIDLRPQTSNSDEREVDEHGNPVLREGDPDAGMAPPLGPHATAGEQQRMSVRRSIMLGLMGVSRSDRLTRDERVLALRQLRRQQLARESQEQEAAVAETPDEVRTTRSRLRTLLASRMRRRPTQTIVEQPPNESNESAGPDQGSTSAGSG